MAALSRHFRVCTRFRQLLPVSCNKIRQNNRRHLGSVKVSDNDLKLFLRDDVQEILKKITELDTEQLFGGQISAQARRPKYKLFSDEELKEEMDRARGMMEKHLQMPPYMKEREKRNEVLANDPDIAPVLTSKYVFIDISERENEAGEVGEAVVVVRHPDGQLKWADWSVLDRVVQIYKPVPGRKVIPPKMFEQENLEKILHPENYLYLLEAACSQYEPDSGDFIRVTHRIYEHLFNNNNFYILRATRFFGPMAFYVAKLNKIEPLMIYMLENNRVSDAVDLINLKMILHDKPKMSGPDLAVVSEYMKSKANRDFQQQLVNAVKLYMTRRSNRGQGNARHEQNS